MSGAVGLKSEIHGQFCQRHGALSDWFARESRGLGFAFSTSYDIREAQFKVAPVDANVFPAGFNNICQVDKDHVPELVQTFFKRQFPSLAPGGVLGLLTEEHTKNRYYWENVATLRDFLTCAGFSVEILFPGEDLETGVMNMETAGGRVVEVKSAHEALKEGSKYQLVLSNNDFSKTYDDVEKIAGRVHPPYALGWHRRKKSDFFLHYNRLARDFAAVANVDPWQFEVATIEHPKFDVESEESRGRLAAVVDRLLADLKKQYTLKGVQSEPFVVIKNNSGTYGLGVITARAGQEVVDWSYKSRKKMKAAKGGGGITDVIVQEGIPSVLKTLDGETAEPVVYMLGDELAGGFLRVHGEKGPDENLNAPGSVYKRLCLSDLRIDHSKVPMENVYGWVAKVASLAVAAEIKDAATS